MIRPTLKFLEFIAPVSDLALRLWVANVFFKSGVNKFQSPDVTLMLFQHEYAVPILSPALAANLATWVELIVPVLLAIGLAGRLSATVLFVFNIVAVISYPTLNEAGQMQHVLWGIMLLVPMLHGPGKLSIDHFVRKRYLN